MILNSYNFEYRIILVGILFSFTLASLLFYLSYKGIKKYQFDYEKNSAYECGFDPFEDTRNKFDVKFYLVSILFIVFDLEVIFLFPWAVTLDTIGYFSFCSIIIFLFVLTIGFYYEWKKGALDWSLYNLYLNTL